MPYCNKLSAIRKINVIVIILILKNIMLHHFKDLKNVDKQICFCIYVSITVPSAFMYSHKKRIIVGLKL